MGSVAVTPAGDKSVIAAYTWATKPSASAVPPGTVIRVTDVGVNGSLWWSNGTAWVHESAIVIAQSGIPMILPSSGSIGNNGDLSGIAPLPATYSGGCYMYFPANAIAAGVAAGLYYVVMSSTTAGTIYNNTYTSGTPAPPASPTAFSTTGPGAYTQTTGADITLLSNTLIGGVLGNNGELRIKMLLGNINNANAKGVKNIFGGQTISNVAGANSFGSIQERAIKNIGAQNSQITAQLTTAGGNFGATAVVNFSVDASADVTVSQVAQLSTATDWIGIFALSAEVLPQ
jgi:hypothetical protein